MVKKNKEIRNGSPAVKNDTNIDGETGFSLQTVDKSMKFLTTTIKGARKWSEFRDQIPLVFEVFATLDSVPTSNNNGTAKLFNIKDPTGSSRCIYWEMDQKLPRMARGQMYRLVGALERKTGHFQCFTIRPAQASEQHLVTQQVKICDDAMTKLVSMISES
ncbi:spermatogenesis-associated protein 22-like [Dendronephthya gigantea]|uniref:spermatogenesis-associated protein 22-like n=1 Tax=Dendronephthya gigantea TaxID=151771 RepID=UPI00106CCE98|nr:spermatogenesis-associated protein 22-like [Dendronephthya gigantea]